MSYCKVCTGVLNLPKPDLETLTPKTVEADSAIEGGSHIVCMFSFELLALDAEANCFSFSETGQRYQQDRTQSEIHSDLCTNVFVDTSDDEQVNRLLLVHRLVLTFMYAMFVM